MRPMPFATLALMSGAALAGCDPQAETDYPGESLLQLTGSVEIADVRTEGELSAALVFGNEWGDRLEVVEVESSGEFPSRFTLNVYSPPPEEVQYRFFEGEPLLSVGYITAVPEQHSQTIRFASRAIGMGTASCDVGACEHVEQWCTLTDELCYTERSVCDTPLEGCEVVSTEGDPSLKRDPYTQFAGFSKNYIVLYLADDAAASSVTALVFGDGAGLAAGYHLIESRPRSAEERAADEACYASAAVNALADYNEQFGKSYTDVAQLEAAQEPCSAEPGVECIPPDLDAHNFYDLQDLAILELRCAQTYNRLRPVEASPDHPITVTVGSSVGPTDWEGADSSAPGDDG